MKITKLKNCKVFIKLENERYDDTYLYIQKTFG